MKAIYGVRGSGYGRPATRVARWPLMLGVLVTLVAALAIVAAAGVWPPWAEEDSREAVYPDVTADVEQLAAYLGTHGVIVVDARPRDSYLMGHIPGAISLPAESITDPLAAPGVFSASGLTGREAIVCTGDSTYAACAARLFWLLELAGARSASLLEGGVRSWSELGNPLEGSEEHADPAEWEVEPETDRLATAPDVEAVYGERGLEILDARGWDAWEGVREEMGEEALAPASRAGHIPHALAFDFHRLLLPGGRLMLAEEARQILAEFGPRPATPVDIWGEFIVHDDGESGEGALGYFLLRRAGIEDVRYYPGGWSDWAGDEDLPTVRIIHADELAARLAEDRRWFKADTPPASFAFFDVRHGVDYERGHIPGAVNLSSSVFADSLDAAVDRHWPDVDRADFPIVIYCYGPTCIRSRDCSTAAARAGFIRVERLYGGVQEWLGTGGELARRH
jgi:thiosulfate/3-mercaptopyruvate sulfurtransferase